MGERWPARVWLPWALTAVLACAGLALGLLVAAGRVEVRPAGPPPAPPPQTSAPPAGPRIEPAAGVDEFLEMVGQKAYCFRYAGTLIDCWIEAEVDGKTTRLGEIPAAKLRAAARAGADGPPAGGEPSGRLVWVLRREEKGQEVWDLAVSLAEGGKAVAGSSLVGITPPRPSSARGSGQGPAEGGPLRGGQEVTLATIYTFGEKAGQVTRKVALKCRAAE